MIFQWYSTANFVLGLNNEWKLYHLGSHGDTEPNWKHVAMVRHRNRKSIERKCFWILGENTQCPSGMKPTDKENPPFYFLPSEIDLKFHHSVEVTYCLPKKVWSVSSSLAVSYTYCGILGSRQFSLTPWIFYSAEKKNVEDETCPRFWWIYILKISTSNFQNNLTTFQMPL